MAGVFPLWKLCRENLHIRNEYVKGALGEFLGTAILLMFVVGSGMQFELQKGSTLTPVLGGSMGIMTAILITGGISGAHINPAVTLGLTIAGELSWFKLPVYWVAQLFGGYVGSGFAVAMYKGIADFKLRASDPTDSLGLGYRDIIPPGVFSPVPLPCGVPKTGVAWGGFPIALGTGILDQIMCTSILIMAILACSDPRNMKVPKHFLGLTFGLVVGGITMCFGFNAGAVMNPARDLTPRLMAMTIGYTSEDVMQSYDSDFNCQEWWVVGIFGPLIGATVGAFIYILVIGAHLDEDEEDNQGRGSGQGNNNNNNGNSGDWRSTHFIPKAQSNAPNPPPPPPQQYNQGPAYNGGQGGVNNNGFMRDDMRYRQGY